MLKKYEFKKFIDFSSEKIYKTDNVNNQKYLKKLMISNRM